MKKYQIIPALIAALTLLPLSLVSCTFQQEQKVKPITLNVSASISLSNALIEIKELYSKEKPNVTLVYQLGSSGELQQKIQVGEPVDVFIAGSDKSMNALQETAKIITETRQSLVSNRIVLVAKKQSTIRDFKDLNTNQIKTICLGNQEVPAGQYGEETLKFLGILETIKPKIIFAKNAREVLTNVETGKTDSGIVYMTDALRSPNLKVVAIAPDNSHSSINYSAAVIKDSKNIPESKEFINFLASDQGGAIFVKYGFIIKNNHTDK